MQCANHFKTTFETEILIQSVQHLTLLSNYCLSDNCLKGWKLKLPSTSWDIPFKSYKQKLKAWLRFDSSCCEKNVLAVIETQARDVSVNMKFIDVNDRFMILRKILFELLNLFQNKVRNKAPFSDLGTGLRHRQVPLQWRLCPWPCPQADTESRVVK